MLKSMIILCWKMETTVLCTARFTLISKQFKALFSLILFPTIISKQKQIPTIGFHIVVNSERGHK